MPTSSQRFDARWVPSDLQVGPGVAPTSDDINHPSHYTAHPSGVECIDIAEHMSFNLGNAIKYTWRAGLKTPDAIKDLKKAAWYLNREIRRLEKIHGKDNQREEQREVAQTVADGARKAT